MFGEMVGANLTVSSLGYFAIFNNMKLICHHNNLHKTTTLGEKARHPPECMHVGVIAFAASVYVQKSRKGPNGFQYFSTRGELTYSARRPF
jgi:hypothetical protein